MGGRGYTITYVCVCVSKHVFLKNPVWRIFLEPGGKVYQNKFSNPKNGWPVSFGRKECLKLSNTGAWNMNLVPTGS